MSDETQGPGIFTQKVIVICCTFRISKGRLMHLYAICVDCLEGVHKIVCIKCKSRWDGSWHQLGTMYTYDILAASPCCQVCNKQFTYITFLIRSVDVLDVYRFFVASEFISLHTAYQIFKNGFILLANKPGHVLHNGFVSISIKTKLLAFCDLTPLNVFWFSMHIRKIVLTSIMSYFTCSLLHSRCRAKNEHRTTFILKCIRVEICYFCFFPPINRVCRNSVISTIGYCCLWNHY